MYSLVLSLAFVVGQPPLPPPGELLLPAPPAGPAVPPPGLPPGAILLPAPPARPSKVPTLREFAAQFKPLPGVHEVTVIHPITGKAVDVVFRLPEGTPKKVYVNPRSIVFEYSKRDVTLIFRLFGQADVRYN